MAGELCDSAYGQVSGDFVEDPLKALCDAEGGIQTGPFGSQLHQEDYVAIGTPIITVEHLGENRILHNDIPQVSRQDRERLNRYLLRKGDIVFSRVGSVDRRALVRSDEEGWMFSGRCLRVRPDPRKIDSTFLSYFFGWPAFKEHIRAIAVGATMPSLNTSLLSEVVIPRPADLCEQRAIAHILGMLDDKIELNRRMNETLETMTQAMFKSWYVDFDPVREKIEGRDTDLPKPLSDLFPPRLVNSELGEIPEGWKVVTIGDLAEVVGGSTPSTTESTYWEGGRNPWATPKDLSALNVPVLLETERNITDHGLKQISSGLLPVGTVLLSSRAPIGYLAIAEVPVAINQGFIAMKPRAGIPSQYLRLWAHEKHEEIISRANGSTFLEISKSNFRPIPAILPAANILLTFKRVAEPLYRRVVSNVHESRTLAALRDTLLPKLISGEVRVKDAEKFIGRVV